MKKKLVALAVVVILCTVMPSVSAFASGGSYIVGWANFRDEDYDIICRIEDGEYIEIIGPCWYDDSRTEIYYEGMRGSVLTSTISDYYYDEYDYSDYSEYSEESSDTNVWVDVDLDSQYLSVRDADDDAIFSTEIVSGQQGINDTPTGEFEVLDKETDTYLMGDRHVECWIPFYGGYGIHDASWRENFGGEIYQSNGSHGCVNVPPYAIYDIYNLVNVGTKVVVHY